MYIRTKDGVYEVDEIKPYFLDEKQKLFINNGLKIAVNEKQVIKQSENIEDLCDEFVVFDKEQPNGKLLYYKGFENLKKEFIDFEKDKEKVVVYGAIWCEWGLKYVAKMNDKGELELI